MSSTATSGGIFITGFSAALFGIFTVIHVRLACKFKTWFFQWMSLGALIQTISFIVIAAAVSDAEASLDYEIRAILFVPDFLSYIAQSIIAVSCYSVLTRIIWFRFSSQQREREHLVMRPNHLTTIVSLYEIVTFAVIVAGTAIRVHGIVQEASLSSGPNVLLAGFILQLCSRLYLLAVIWRVTVIRNEWNIKTTGLNYDTKTMLHVVHFCGILLTIKTFYGVIVLGAKVIPAAWTFYVFEAAPLFIILVSFAGIHPGQALPFQFTQLRLDTRLLAENESQLSGDTIAIAQVQTHEAPSSPKPIYEVHAHETRVHEMNM